MLFEKCLESLLIAPVHGGFVLGWSLGYPGSPPPFFRFQWVNSLPYYVYYPAPPGHTVYWWGVLYFGRGLEVKLFLHYLFCPRFLD